MTDYDDFMRHGCIHGAGWVDRSDEAITERLYKSYAKDRNNGETHEDMAKCYGSDAAEFLKRYDTEQAEYSALMRERVKAAE